MSVYRDTIQRGQRVYCTLPHAGNGTVVAIHGEQSPESCQAVARSVGVAGGRAQFDIVWDNGGRSARTPEALLRASVQWRVFDEVVDETAVSDAIAHAEQVARARQAAKEAADSEHERQKAELDNDPEFAGLARVGDSDAATAKVAAANLRKLLRQRFKAVKFSVRMDGYNAIRVRWTDGPTAAEVKALSRRFKRGNFDGMTDSYDYQRSPWCQLFGGVEYVFEEREFSDEHTTRAIEALWQRYPGNLEGIQKPTPEALRAGDYRFTEVPGFDHALPTLVRLEAIALAG